MRLWGESDAGSSCASQRPHLPSPSSPSGVLRACDSPQSLNHSDTPSCAGYRKRGAEYIADQCVASGTSTEVGCHHAEMNAVANAVNKGVSLNGCSIVVSVSPCLMCAKMIHHAGISHVYIPMSCNYLSDGVQYLRACGLFVSSIPMGDIDIPF